MRLATWVALAWCGLAWGRALPYLEPRLDADTEENFTQAYRYYNEHDFRAPDRLTYDRIVERIEKENLTSVNDLLASLRKTGRYGKLFRFFTLMHGSQSLHRKDISPKYPRVIFHGDSLALTVTGDPSKPSYGSLEVMEYHADEGKFRFHEIVFDGKSRRYDTDSGKCLQCHGQPQRPLWGSYFLWPGAYFGGDEFVPRERTNFRDFVSRLKDEDMARYRHFLRDESGFDFQANTKLSVHLSRMNFDRVFFHLKKTDAYRSYRFAIAGVFYGCGDMESFLPPSLVKEHWARLDFERWELLFDVMNTVRSDTARRARLFEEMHGAPVPDALPGRFDESHGAMLVSLRFLLEGQRLTPDLNLKDWAISRPRGGWSYNMSNGAEGIKDALYAHILPEMKPLFGTFRPDCDDLRKKSLEALKPLAR